MSRPIYIGPIGMAILLACQISFAEQTTEPKSSLPIQKSNLHVVYDPPQLEMIGPYPFRGGPTFSYTDAAVYTAFAPAIFAGIGLDGIAAITRTPNVDPNVQQSREMPGSSHDYLQTTVTSLSRLSSETDLIVTGIDPFRFSRGSRTNASWIFENGDADYVLFFRSTYFMAPELDQLRMRATVDLYSRKGDEARTNKIFRRDYEYLSPSRGILFRPFAEGEKDALMSMIEMYFEQKTEKFPHNSRAYKKDRNHLLRTIRNRNTILPDTAVNEGWPEESMAFEIQTATNHIIFMIQQDLLSRDSDAAPDRRTSKFVIMSDSGKTKTLKGHAIGSFENNTIYRDRYGNKFSLPVSAPDVE